MPGCEADIVTMNIHDNEHFVTCLWTSSYFCIFFASRDFPFSYSGRIAVVIVFLRYVNTHRRSILQTQSILRMRNKNKTSKYLFKHLIFFYIFRK